MKFLFSLFFFAFCITNGFAQTQINKKNIGLFAPLYLDSVFKTPAYKSGKKFPRFALPAIDFIQGAKIAIDSFPLDNEIVTLQVFDTKSDSVTVESMINYNQLDNLDLIIGLVKDNDLDLLASFAKQKKIPFVSVTHPNDNGVEDNPYFIMLNPSLKTHCESIFSYLLQNHGSDNILLVRKPGSQEDKTERFFNSINKPDKKALLKINSIQPDSAWTNVSAALDSTRKNCIIGASLDETFAKELVSNLKKSPKKFDLLLFGMPNWSGFSAFSKNIKSDYRDFSFYYTTPYFNNKTDSISLLIQNSYLNQYKGTPSEMAYKGFETVYLFSRALTLDTKEISTVINDAKKLFTSFRLLPVQSKESNKAVNYFENKNLYFIKKTNGMSSIAW
jgi:hypothetical protein